MAQSTINERLKTLIDSLGMSARAFSYAIGSGDTNTRNYLDRGSKPGADYLEKILRRFESVNPAWLVTGDEPFLAGKDNSAHSIEIDTRRSKGNIQGASGTTNTINNPTIEDCRRDLEACKKEIEPLRRELELQAALLASKEETITLLRASYNRPN